MLTVLPPNASEQEKNLEIASNYAVGDRTPRL